MHAYSDSPNSSGVFYPLEPVFKLSDGFYRDLYAVRSFGSLRRQQMRYDGYLPPTCRQQVMPKSMHILSKSRPLKTGKIVRHIH